MIYAQEALTPAVEAEIETMARGYYATTPAHIGIPPYQFRWEVYRSLAEQGVFLLFTAREPEDGGLQGFVFYTLFEHPHHAGLIVADGNIVTAPATRGKGVATALYQFGEPVLAARGARSIVHRHRLCYGASPLFPKLGFTESEILYVKEIAA